MGHTYGLMPVFISIHSFIKFDVTQLLQKYQHDGNVENIKKGLILGEALDLPDDCRFSYEHLLKLMKSKPYRRSFYTFSQQR